MYDKMKEIGKLVEMEAENKVHNNKVIHFDKIQTEVAPDIIYQYNSCDLSHSNYNNDGVKCQRPNFSDMNNNNFIDSNEQEYSSDSTEVEYQSNEDISEQTFGNRIVSDYQSCVIKKEPVNCDDNRSDAPYVVNNEYIQYAINNDLKESSESNNNRQMISAEIEQNSLDCYDDQGNNCSAVPNVGLPGRHFCKICKKNFKTRRSFKIHTGIHTQPFVCADCGERFSRNDYLKKHVARMHSGLTPHVCEICGKGFYISGHLRRHIQTHSKVRRHECHICQHAFSEKYDLQVHSLVHTGIRPHLCSDCGKTFSTSSHLSRHRKRVHIKGNIFYCGQCPMYFFDKSNLDTHFQVHTGERNYKCDICGKTFTRSNILQVHLRTHTKEKPFACQFCTQFFSDRKEAKRHERRVHIKEKPFGCAVCASAFFTNSELKRHSRVHGVTITMVQELFQPDDLTEILP